MKKKELLHEIAQRLRKIRDTLGLSAVDMTENIKTHRATYYKYENAMAFPHFTILSRLGNSLGISMDWLILNRGSMLYKEKVSENEAAANPLDALPRDIKELVEHMVRIPMLKYETLLSFHQFKENHKELVASSMMEKVAPAAEATAAAPETGEKP
jgi:transcriptional regulator with XRE-family HTH domain